MEHDPIQNDARRARREQQLGEQPVCALCGCAEFDALIPVTRKLLEAHHLAGRHHDVSLTVPLCRNCHAIETEKLRCAGADMRPQASLLDRIVAVLRALGTALVSMGEALTRWAEHLARLITGLDEHHPTWREMPEAV